MSEKKKNRYFAIIFVTLLCLAILGASGCQEVAEPTVPEPATWQEVAREKAQCPECLVVPQEYKAITK